LFKLRQQFIPRRRQPRSAPRGRQVFAVGHKWSTRLAPKRGGVDLRRADLMNMQNAYHQSDESSPKKDAHTNVNERVYFLPPFGWFRMREQNFSGMPAHHII